jgi:hypothetical protein
MRRAPQTGVDKVCDGLDRPEREDADLDTLGCQRVRAKLVLQDGNAGIQFLDRLAVHRT